MGLCRVSAATGHRRLSALRVGPAAVATVALLAVVLPAPLAFADPAGDTAFGARHVVPTDGAHVADLEPATRVQQTEPEGVDTTDPESSDEDGSPAPSWLAYVIIGLFTTAFLYWYLRRLRREDSAGSD